MRNTGLVLLTAGLLSSTMVARADVIVDAGLTLWYAEPKVSDRAMMYGPSVRLDIDETWWIRGYYLYGEYDFVRSREPRRVQDFGLHDAELLAGMNWDIFRFGAGARWMAVLIEDRSGAERRVRTSNAVGPVLVVGAEQSFAEWPWGFEGSPWGWYAGVSWMFYDMEDDDGEHLSIEAGITHVSHGIYKSIGYRFRETFDHERMEGFTATLLFEF